MDTGSSAFILICSAMVCLMTPALAFFYGGLGRRKNVINTMMMSVLPLAIASLLWIVAGYSLSFGGHGNIFGNFSHLFLNGVSETASSRGLTIPDMLFAAFQMMFSIICVAILTGSVGRKDALYTFSHLCCLLVTSCLLSICTYGLGRRAPC